MRCNEEAWLSLGSKRGWALTMSWHLFSGTVITDQSQGEGWGWDGSLPPLLYPQFSRIILGEGRVHPWATRLPGACGPR